MNTDKETDKNIEELNKKLKDNPNLSLAKEYYNKNDYINAIRYLNKAIDMAPNNKEINKEIYYSLAMIYTEQKEYDIAIEKLKNALEIDTKFVLAYQLLGNIYGRKKDYDTSIKYLNKAIEINPNDNYSYMLIGVAFSIKLEYNSAIESFKKVIDLNKNNSEDYAYNLAYHLLSGVYRLKREYDFAIEILKKAIEKNTKNFVAYLHLGGTYICKKDYDNAIKYLSEAINIKQDCFEAYSLLGTSYKLKREYNTAIQNYKKAIETNPKYSPVYFGLIDVYLEQEDYNSAFELSLKNTDTLINGFAKKLKNIFETDKKIPIEYKKILFKVYKLWELLKISDIEDFKEENFYLYQYRKFDFLETVLKNKNFWLNPTDYQNDPNEGKAVLKYLSFENNKETNNSDLVAFISCFSALKDNLVMWNSSYAEDGKGISIGIDIEKLYTKEILSGTNMLSGIYIMPIFSEEKNIEKNFGNKQFIEENEEKNLIPVEKIGLYKILYINLEEKIEENDTNKKAKILLKKIKILYTKIIEDAYYKNNTELINNWLNELFILIRYLIKFDDYEHEKEYRLLYVGNILNNKYVKSKTCLEGIHVETEKILFNNKEKKDRIIIGPKSNNKINILKINHYLKNNDIDKYIEVKPSEIDFR